MFSPTTGRTRPAARAGRPGGTRGLAGAARAPFVTPRERGSSGPTGLGGTRGGSGRGAPAPHAEGNGRAGQLPAAETAAPLTAWWPALESICRPAADPPGTEAGATMTEWVGGVGGDAQWVGARSASSARGRQRARRPTAGSRDGCPTDGVVAGFGEHLSACGRPPRHGGRGHDDGVGRRGWGGRAVGRGAERQLRTRKATGAQANCRQPRRLPH